MDFSLVVDGHTVSIFAAAAAGAVAGLIAGMFGIGGGFLLVPLLHVVLGVPIASAVGASLCAIVATATGAFLRHRSMGFAESRFDLILIGGGIMGVHAGARMIVALQGGSVELLGKAIPAHELAVTAIYTVVYLGAAIMLLVMPRPEPGAPARRGPLARIPLPPRVDLHVAGISRVSAPTIAYIGFAAGFLAGALGVTGGVLLIPIMLFGFGFNIRAAAGTGVIVVLVVAVIGTIQHARAGHVHLGLASAIMVGSALAAQVGAGLTHSLPDRTLRRILALIVAGSAAMMTGQLIAR